MWVGFDVVEVLGKCKTDVVQMLSVIFKGGFRDVLSEHFFRSESNGHGIFYKIQAFLSI